MQTQNNLIHVGRTSRGYVYLRKLGELEYRWFEEDNATDVVAPHAEEAIRLGFRKWDLRLIHCGFRYTLPERDEHGINALFYQMGASYESMNGVYFEEELGFNCIVHNPSDEARHLWNKLKSAGKL
jgi:hypothetical protein